MKKNMIAFRSVTGHSKKMAHKISKELNLEVIQIGKYDSKQIEATNLFIIGGIYSGNYHQDIYDFVSGLDVSKIDRITLITSSATGKESPEKIKDLIKTKKIKLNEEEFTYKGRFFIVSINHPNAEDYKAAINFVKKILEK